ncbi:MAG: hypothetical protein AAGM22_29575, partial [Acidobacteriota bacterium]
SPPGLVEDIFVDLEEMWQKPHHLRTLGALLVDAAAQGGWLHGISSSVVIRRVDGQTRRQSLGAVPGVSVE